MASLSQGRTAAAQCGLFTHKSVPVIFEPPCIIPSNLHADIYPTILPTSYLCKRRRKTKHFSPTLRRKSGVIAARFCGAASNIRHSNGGAIINAPEIR